MEAALLAYLQTYITERRRQLFKRVLDDRTRHFTVVTEDVYQLHNTSAVMRSCDVFGIQDLHVIEERLGKRVDSEIAMGAQKWVDIYRHHSSRDCMEALRQKGYQIIATTPHGNSTLLHEFDITQKSAFFFGTEKSGISDTVLDAADGFLKIPMYGFTESLNISVSAAIILQEIVTRMRIEEIPWQLTSEEKGKLELQWTRRSIKNINQIEAHFYNQKKT